MAVFLGVSALLALSEFLTRVVYQNINLMDTSPNLFAYRVYGNSYANARNVVASSFGSTIVTDGYGFRIDPAHDYRSKEALPSIIFLGDSIAFGSGVPADQTFVELLNQRLANYRVINTAVVGYDVNDYKNVVDYFLIKNKDKLKIKHIILALCLNDIETISNTQIVYNMPTGQPIFPASLFANLRSWFGLNDFLKSHSKLFLLLKSYIYDSGKIYFQYDAKQYHSQEAVKNMVEPLIYLNQLLTKNNISFTIIIQPYEYQLREQNKTDRYPLEVLRNQFKANGIDYRDGYEFFAKEMQARNLTSKELYLFNDPMHFSPLGHRLMYELISQDVLKID